MIFKYGSRVARMTATYANTFTDIQKTTAGYHYLCPVLLPSWQNLPYPAAFFISNIYAGFLLFKKKTASESPFLETRTFRLHRNRRIASGDSDVFRAAPAVCIINTVRCLALYFETVLRCFKKVAECAAFLLVEAAAAGIAFILRRLSFYQNGIFTAAVFRIVHTSGYTTIQFCHDFSSCFLTCITESLLRHPAIKLFSDTLFNVSWFSLLFTHVWPVTGFYRYFAFQIGKICNQNCIVRNFQFRKFLPVNSYWFLDSGVVSASFLDLFV